MVNLKISNSNAFLNALKENLNINGKDYVALITGRSNDPFRLLVMTILSQNTSDRNAMLAFRNLSSKIQIDAASLASAPLPLIKELIRPAGLFRRRAEILKNVSTIILERFNGNLENILNRPCREAREILISLPGVGRKTADILLLFTGRCKTFPVDTHISRVSKRIGVVPENADYEQIRSAWMKLYEPSNYLLLHLLLIALGRSYCKSRNPLHDQCPVRYWCKYWMTLKNRI
ncbi:MAG: endonuclease III [archaeon GB-1867-097]|nr:endonuclease III [Candidatus Culexmicrobium thermophilum]